jgi:chemotaxis protein CheY-P-specific phosphatase CheC
VTALQERDIDRLSELANIGAGHAAGAFARLTGESIMMEVPRIRLSGLPINLLGGEIVIGEENPAGAEDRDWSTGVIFEFDGCLNAVVAILFRRSMCDAVVRKLTGQSEGYLPSETVESALMEVGNVLASHVASAIADTVGARLLPSIPMLAIDSAFEQLESLAESRGKAGDLWIECELVDCEGNLGGLVVLVPDRENL